MQWIHAKKASYTTPVHKLSENEQHIFNTLSSSPILGLQTEMFPLWLHFQLEFLIVNCSTRTSMLIICLQMICDRGKSLSTASSDV